MLQRDGLALISRIVPDAVSLGEAAFREATREAYLELLRIVAEYGHVVRIWNFIPSILAPLGALPHRYMVFNAGRFAAYESHLGCAGAFAVGVATASGTGHAGADLAIHALAFPEPGRSVENPRQVPAYRYSQRYGPRPPCFARATLLQASSDAPDRLLVGGTASILGEDSEHLHQLDAQVDETLRNLEALVAAGWVQARNAESLQPSLSCFKHVRVYHPERIPSDAVRIRLVGAFDRVESFELVTADLCRPELLVEIEGLAEL